MRSIVAVAALALLASPLVAQKETPPPVGRPKNLKLPAPREFTLPNGLRVTLVAFGTVPKVDVELAVRAAEIQEGRNEVWLSDVLADLMQEGTLTRTAAQVAEQAAGMGGDLSVSAGTHTTTIGGEVLSDHAADMIRLVADVARHPRLPESELERIKADRIRGLAISMSQAQPIADQAFRKAIYGDHPFGRPYPTEAMLKIYTIDQVRGFYARNYGAGRSHLYVVGVFDQAATEAAIRMAFAGWARGTPAVEPAAHPVRSRTVTLLDRPDAVQSTLIVGLPVAAPRDTDYLALQVTDALLGGSFGSRITSNIREQKGYTYSPFSTVTSFRGESYWAEQADVTTNVTGASLKEIFGEINRLRSEAPSDAELTGIKNNLAGIFTLRNSSRAGIIGLMRFVDLQGLGNDYLGNYVGRVLDVTPSTVQHIAQKYLNPDQMTIVVVGDKKTVDPQLTPYRGVVP
jgi:predicted Zn-dependent peptidase